MILLLIGLFVFAMLFITWKIGSGLKKGLREWVEEQSLSSVEIDGISYIFVKDGFLEVLGGACAIDNSIYLERRFRKIPFVLDHEQCHIKLGHSYVVAYYRAAMKAWKSLALPTLCVGVMFGDLTLSIILLSLGYLIAKLLMYRSDVTFELQADSKMVKLHQFQLADYLCEISDNPRVRKRVNAIRGV